MKTLRMLAALAVAACLTGCGAISLEAEKSAEISGQHVSVTDLTFDPYEPDNGGQYMTPSAPRFTYTQTIYPADDVDFRYMEAVGSYTLVISPVSAMLHVQVWTRAQKLYGPSTLIREALVRAGDKWEVPFTLTQQQSFVVVRVEAAPGEGITAYTIGFDPQGEP